MGFNQGSDISTLTRSRSLKLVEKFTNVKSSVSSTKNDIKTRLAKAWTPLDRLSVISVSDLSDKLKCTFFQAVVVSILLYRCTTETLTKHMEKKLDSNYTRMMRAVLNEFERQRPTKQQFYGHLPPITKTIQIRWTWHARHCWRRKGELISNIPLCSPSQRRAKVGRPDRTYLQQFSADTGWSLEDLLGLMDDRDE